MSGTNTKTSAPSFFALYRRGAATAGEIDDFVGRWHRGLEHAAKDLALHDYLGLTREEYEVLLYDAEALPQILAARESQRPLAGLMAGRLRDLQAATGRRMEPRSFCSGIGWRPGKPHDRARGVR